MILLVQRFLANPAASPKSGEAEGREGLEVNFHESVRSRRVYLEGVFSLRLRQQIQNFHYSYIGQQQNNKNPYCTQGSKAAIMFSSPLWSHHFNVLKIIFRKPIAVAFQILKDVRRILENGIHFLKRKFIYKLTSVIVWWLKMKFIRLLLACLSLVQKEWRFLSDSGTRSFLWNCQCHDWFPAVIPSPHSSSFRISQFTEPPPIALLNI